MRRSRRAHGRRAGLEVEAIGVGDERPERFRARPKEPLPAIPELPGHLRGRSVSPPLRSCCACLPSCGQENPEGFRFCGVLRRVASGTALAANEERRIRHRPVRRSGRFHEHRGASRSGGRPRAARAGLRPTATRHVKLDGIVEKFIGDAVMAIFGAPVAHEDDPERAVRAALAIRDAIAQLSEEAGQSGAQRPDRDQHRRGARSPRRRSARGRAHRGRLRERRGPAPGRPRPSTGSSSARRRTSPRSGRSSTRSSRLSWRKGRPSRSRPGRQLAARPGAVPTRTSAAGHRSSAGCGDRTPL